MTNSGSDQRAARLFVVAVMLLAVVVVSAICWSAVAVWDSAHSDDAARVQRADAIVVLGAAQYNGRVSPVFRSRLDAAARLWRQQRAGVVLVLGANQPGDTTTEGESGRHYLLDEGVTPSAVVAIPVGNTTYQSLAGAATYLRGHDMTTVFLVSDPWHNARCQAMATELGLSPYVSATWNSAYTSRGARLRGYLRETFAYLHFKVFGGS